MLSELTSFINSLPLDSLQNGDLLNDSVGQSTDAINSFVNQVGSTYEIAVSAVLLVLALIGCFFGYKLCRLFMSLTGFIAGAILGYIVSAQFLHVEGYLAFVCVIAGGLILGALACWIYRVGIFILCFALGFTASMSYLPLTGDALFFAGVLIALVIAVLAVKFLRPVIILTSAIVCGTSAAHLLPTVASYIGISIFSTTITGLGLNAGLCVLGILVQFLTTKDPTIHKHD